DLLDGGEQEADQDRDDGNYHQQLDQREAATGRAGLRPHWTPPSSTRCGKKVTKLTRAEMCEVESNFLRQERQQVCYTYRKSTHTEPANISARHRPCVRGQRQSASWGRNGTARRR